MLEIDCGSVITVFVYENIIWWASKWVERCRRREEKN